MRCVRLLARRRPQLLPQLLLPCAVGLCLWASARLWSEDSASDPLSLQSVIQRGGPAAAAGDSIQLMTGSAAPTRDSAAAALGETAPWRLAPMTDARAADGVEPIRRQRPPLPPAPASAPLTTANPLAGPIATSEISDERRASADLPFVSASEQLATAAASTFDDLKTIAPDKRCTVSRRKINSSSAASANSSLAIIILLRNLDDSVPVQTAVSAVAFTPPDLLGEVVFAYASRVSPDYIRRLLGSLESYRRRGLAMRTVRGATYYAAAMSAAASTRVAYVALVHDSIVFSPGWAGPLLDAAAARPLSAALPHVDALLPNLVYSHPYSEQAYVEAYSLAWRVDWGLAYRKHEVPYLTGGGGGDTRPLDTAVTTGDAVLAPRALFELVSSVAAVGSFLELSFLTWMCGGGMQIVGCSRLFKVNKYFVFPPYVNADTRDKLARLYMGHRYHRHYAAATGAGESVTPRVSMYDAESRTFLDDLGQRGCRSFEWYVREVVRLPFTDLPPDDADLIHRMGQLQNAASELCFTFDFGGTATEAGSCHGLASVVYTTRDAVLHLQRGCLASVESAAGRIATVVRRCNDTNVSFFKLVDSESVITDGETCLARKLSPGNHSRFVAIPSRCPEHGQRPPPDMLWSLI